MRLWLRLPNSGRMEEIYDAPFKQEIQCRRELHARNTTYTRP